MRPDPKSLTSMTAVRAGIDDIDIALVRLLAERQAHVDRAIDLKPAEGISASAPKRAADVLSKVRSLAEAEGLDPDLAEKLWRSMIETFIAREERVLGQTGEDR